VVSSRSVANLFAGPFLRRPKEEQKGSCNPNCNNSHSVCQLKIAGSGGRRGGEEGVEEWNQKHQGHKDKEDLQYRHPFQLSSPSLTVTVRPIYACSLGRISGFGGVSCCSALSMVWLFIGCLRRLFPKPLHLEHSSHLSFRI